MSKLLLVYNRKHNTSSNCFYNQAKAISKHIIPDNIMANAPKIIQQKGLQLAIFNPLPSNQIFKNGVCLGMLYEDKNDWDVIGTKKPDGNYAIFRFNGEFIELVSDIQATRTIWYYYDDSVFIASTSQRAIIQYRQSFNFNEKVIPWMISSGFTGPDLSWDIKIKQLPPDSILSLNIKSWNIKLILNEVNFKIRTNNSHSRKNLVKELRELIDHFFTQFKLDNEKWVMAISGGVDSRGILAALVDSGKKPNTITWGTKSGLSDRKSDSYIAKEFAQRIGVDNKFFEVEYNIESFEQILKRYLIAGEGRIDHIGGYLDGFAIWKKLYESGIYGIIRGDQAFGWSNINFPNEAQLNVGIHKYNENPYIKKHDTNNLIEQYYPDYLNQNSHEPVQTWIDRLQHVFRNPTVKASLNDLKLPYVEVSNPLLNNALMHFTRALPHAFRCKDLYKNYIDSISPKLPYAKKQSLYSNDQIFSQDKIFPFLMDELSHSAKLDFLPKSLILALSNDLHHIKGNEHSTYSISTLTKSLVKQILPVWLKGFLKSRGYKNHPSLYKLAFRIIILSNMYTILSNDAILIDQQKV